MSLNPVELAGKLYSSKRGKQVLVLYGSMLLGILVSIAVSAINAKALGADGFGDYKFLQNLSMFAVTCGTVGLFVSGGRLLALSDEYRTNQRIVSATIVFCLILYLIFASGFWVFSFIQPNYFDRDLGELIRLSIPLALGFLVKVMLENLLKGGNHIYSLSIIRLFPNVIYLVFAVILFNQEALDVESAYLGYLGCALVVYLFFVYRLGPVFEGVSEKIRAVWRETKAYGFNVYIGSLASVASAQLGGVLVAYFVDVKSAGFFLLARTITSPLVEMSTAVGTTFFKSFAKKESISKKVFAATFSSVFLLLVLFTLFIGKLVEILYPPEFSEIVYLCYIMAVGSTLQGLGGLINNFICARGFGRFSRNASMLRGASNVIGFTFVVSQFGLAGAAWTVLVSGLLFLLAQLWYYIRIIKGN